MNQTNKQNNNNNNNLRTLFPLTQDQIDEFLQNGMLVVDNVLNELELVEAHEGLNTTLEKYHISPNNLEKTAHNLKSLSSTNGSGGGMRICIILTCNLLM